MNRHEWNSPIRIEGRDARWAVDAANTFTEYGLGGQLVATAAGDAQMRLEILRLAEEVEAWKTERGRLAAELAEVSTERDRFAAENATLKERVAQMEAEVRRERERANGTIFNAQMKATRVNADLLRADEEIAALKATLAEVQQVERWQASVKWDARLSLLAADFRDRASIIRGTTTWEQAFRQAAIDLEEVIEQMATSYSAICPEQHPLTPSSPEPEPEPSRSLGSAPE